MAEVQPADQPATVPDQAEKTPTSQTQNNTQEDKEAKENSLDPKEQPKNGESAHAEDRRENESARVREARKYNNRDRYRADGDNNERSYKKRTFPRNNKFDPSSLPESSDPALIRKQVEFYFSDSNLHGDKFLFTHIEGSKNNPVPIDVIHKFKRMQRFQPRSAIVSALKESSSLNLVNEDNDIQRKVPLPEGLVGKPIHEIKEVHENKSMAQSIYAKGFGEEEASSQFDIEAFFAKYGTTNSVRLRRDLRGNFKGSVFVEFDNEEEAKSFVALDPPPKYKDQALLVKTKKDYCDDKVEDIKAGKVRPNSPDRSGRRNFKERDRDGEDGRDWRERRNEDSKDGFKDRRGGHRGRGSDRGRRGDRGRGRGRDRNDRDRRPRRASPTYENGADAKTSSDEPKQNSGNVGDESAEATTEAQTGSEPVKAVEPPAKSTGSNETTKAVENTQVDQPGLSDTAEPQKKRQREGDDAAEDLPPSKKVDSKSEE